MLKILVLLCPVAIDRSACDESNALYVIRAMRAPSAQQCGFLGQAMLAPTALVPDPRKQYVKITCSRDTTKG